jgi:hypothetical protein
MPRVVQAGTRDGETSENRFRGHPMSLRNVAAGRSGHGQSRRLGNPRTEARVRATPIVMRYPLGQDFPQMPFLERNDMVETFSTHRPDQALAERVRLRHADRCFQDARMPAKEEILGCEAGVG